MGMVQQALRAAVPHLHLPASCMLTSEYKIAGRYYAQNFQVRCFWTWLPFGCVGHILMIVVDLLLAFTMVHVH